MKEIPLHGKKAAGRVALVDDEDYELVSQYHWHVSETARPGMRLPGIYARAMLPRRDGRRPSIRMHVLIMGGRGIDHVDHDGLNNQRHNLRAADQQQNSRNRRPSAGGSSDFKGVRWHKQRRKWEAVIGVGGKARYLGLFADERLAALAYNAAASELFGEFACLNEVGMSAGAA